MEYRQHAFDAFTANVDMCSPAPCLIQLHICFRARRSHRGKIYIRLRQHESLRYPSPLNLISYHTQKTKLDQINRQ